jgi:hypothetical protein
MMSVGVGRVVWNAEGAGLGYLEREGCQERVKKCVLRSAEWGGWSESM